MGRPERMRRKRHRIGRRAVVVIAAAGAAVDVHAHAMPLPLLQRLADRGFADLSGAAAEVVLLDPRVSGVGAGAPLPLARSQYDVAVRLSEIDAFGVRCHCVICRAAHPGWAQTRG